eukprot:CAMPEP_0182879980 /NCGR_PEP_ID=MMETSP0034_2-20130328/16298_1 /TAXON_ID=156128 /ORGANISM="Nephroselmis pyriformis, Strain CCMP717" /LENGTH=71 /DNA_ID=CAMNT_0025012949 /DNA_START=171 /DNA_END=386 /DNA_ORIENTATION=+
MASCQSVPGGMESADRNTENPKRTSSAFSAAASPPPLPTPVSASRKLIMRSYLPNGMFVTSLYRIEYSRAG